MVALSRFVLALWVPAHFGSAVQLRPDVSAENCPENTQSLCIDFGSSGAKFSICGQDAKDEKFPSSAAGAFATTAEYTVEELTVELGQYLEKQFGTMDSHTTCVKVCGGTAGNRFAHLGEKDEASWGNFTKALQNFATIPKGRECHTFTGTEEANFEWAFTKYSPVFIGIGGASMQLHLPSGACPTWGEEDRPFDGGVGANKPKDFCEITTHPLPGVLWSLLADQKFNQATDDKTKNLHIFGGMNEVAARYYHILDTKKLLAVESINGKKLDWVHQVISATALADPMWVAVLQSFHTEGCTALPESKFIVLLANPSLGQKLLNERLFNKVAPHVKQATIEKLLFHAVKEVVKDSSVRLRSLFRPLRRRTEADVLHHAIRQMSAYDGFDAVAEAVASTCLDAVKYQPQGPVKYFTKFDSRNPEKLGFLCTVKLFSLSWMSTLAGHAGHSKKPPDPVITRCFEGNFHKLLDARHMRGDWMLGALALQAPEAKN